MIYLNNAATTLFKPVEVIKASNTLNYGGNRSNSFEETAVFISRLRKELLNYLNANQHDVIITSGCTASLNQAITGFCEGKEPFDILVTQAEHNAVLRPVYALERKGFGVIIAKTDDYGRISPKELCNYLTPKTKLAIITHTSNVTGASNDINAVADVLHEKGITVIADCAQSFGYRDIDLHNVDMAAFPCHKGMHALTGTGFLIISKEITLEPLVYGGTGSLSEEKYMPDFAPERYESGTVNLSGISAAFTALEWLEKYEKQIRSNLSTIGDYLHKRLSALDVTVHSTKNDSGIATFSLNTESFDSVALSQKLYEKGFIVRGGLHCAPLMHQRLSTQKSGAIRVSAGIDTDFSHIDKFINTLEELL